MPNFKDDQQRQAPETGEEDMLLPKSKPLQDKKYKNSFKVEFKHVCILTGATMPDAAHIRCGCFSIGMKPGDDLIMPLRHDLHMEQHKIGEVAFWAKYFDQIPEHMRMRAIEEIATPGKRSDIMDILKQIARNYYKEYNTR